MTTFLSVLTAFIFTMALMYSIKLLGALVAFAAPTAARQSISRSEFVMPAVLWGIFFWVATGGQALLRG